VRHADARLLDHEALCLEGFGNIGVGHRTEQPAIDTGLAVICTIKPSSLAAFSCAAASFSPGSFKFGTADSNAARFSA